MFDRVFGRSSSSVAQEVAGPATILFADNAPSWEQLQSLADERCKELGYSQPDRVTGPTNSYSLLRTFGKTDKPAVKLYRDHAAWCPYCQKVWLLLEEKQIPYEIEKINMRCYGDKPRSFTAKVPSGLLPVLEIGGKVITESAVIMNLLEELFPERPMMPPADSPLRAKATALMRLERQLFGVWLDWLCSNSGYDPKRKRFEEALDVVNAELDARGGPYFLGDDISMVDIVFAPFLERMVASVLYYKGLRMRGEGRWPAIDRWFEAMEARSTYIGTKSDFYTHVHDLPPQLGGCGLAREGEPFARKIDGQDGETWSLPLPPLDGSSLEPYSPGENPPVDRLQAALRMIENHTTVVPFALRGCGAPGQRPVSARLCDPTAVPGSQHEKEADALLRHVVHALLVGVETKQASPSALQRDDGGLRGSAAWLSAEYVRDRICVPRDLKFPAVRQLRAHLNWAMDAIAKSS